MWDVGYHRKYHGYGRRSVGTEGCKRSGKREAGPVDMIRGVDGVWTKMTTEVMVGGRPTL